MRIALFSDVHGNLTGLREVWSAIEHEGGFDAIVCAGDLASMRPHPQECLDFLQEKGIACVIGNGDLMLLGRAEPNKETVRRKPFLADQLAWCIDHVSEEGRRFLRSLPLTLRFSPGGQDDDLLVCHATPNDVHPVCLPDASDEEWEKTMGHFDATALAFGHVHVPQVRDIRGKLFADVAHSGLGSADMVGYTILTFSKGSWQAERRPVAHDPKVERGYALSIGFPGADVDEYF